MVKDEWDNEVAHCHVWATKGKVEKKLVRIERNAVIDDQNAFTDKIAPQLNTFYANCIPN